MISEYVFSFLSLSDFSGFFWENNEELKRINVKKIISYEKIDTESLLIEEILDEDVNEKIINNNLKRNMPACIIYTSGTSGNPKGSNFKSWRNFI